MENSTDLGDFTDDTSQTQNVFSQINAKKIKRSTRHLPICQAELKKYIESGDTKHAFGEFYKSW